MPFLSLKCTASFKDFVTTHVKNQGGRYRSVSHFMQESIVDRINSEVKPPPAPLHNHPVGHPHLSEEPVEEHNHDDEGIKNDPSMEGAEDNFTFGDG